MTKHDLNELLFYSFRYALGRKTYAVGDVCRILIENKDDLFKLTRLKMCDEIYRALQTDNAGMDCDKRIWHQVLEEFEKIKDKKSICECEDRYHPSGAICCNGRSDV